MKRTIIYYLGFAFETIFVALLLASAGIHSLTHWQFPVIIFSILFFMLFGAGVLLGHD